MNGGCLYLSTGGVHQKNSLIHAGHQSSEVNHFPQEQVVGQERLVSKTGLWTRLLLEELSALTTVAFRDTAIKFVCNHTQAASLASLVLWLRHMGSCWRRTLLWWKSSESWKESHSDFYLSLSQREMKKSVWIYFIWQCKDRSQRRNPNDENSLEP